MNHLALYPAKKNYHSLEYKVLNIDKKKINPDQEELLSYMPGGKNVIDLHTRELTSSLLIQCLKIMEPKGGYVALEALHSADMEEISTRNTRFRPGKIIVNMLKGSEQFLFFMATAGPGPEKLSKTLIAKGDYLEGFLVDLIASALAEATTQYVHDHLKEFCSNRGLKITNRYSPGYCGWEVSEQQKLFGLFPEQFCGISLTESSLMTPIKSVSSLVGAGPDVKFRDYTCEICSMKDCTFRRTRATHGSLT